MPAQHDDMPDLAGAPSQKASESPVVISPLTCYTSAHYRRSRSSRPGLGPGPHTIWLTAPLGTVRVVPRPFTKCATISTTITVNGLSFPTTLLTEPDKKKPTLSRRVRTECGQSCALLWLDESAVELSVVNGRTWQHRACCPPCHLLLPLSRAMRWCYRPRHEHRLVPAPDLCHCAALLY
jgi:hypothetical protein